MSWRQRRDERAIRAYADSLSQSERYDEYCAFLADMAGYNSAQDVRYAYSVGQIFLPGCFGDIVRLIERYLDGPFDTVMQIVG